MVNAGATETQAYVIEAQGQAPILKTIPLAPLRDNEVEIDMKYCGLCHTDCAMQSNEWGISTFPQVVGHEGTGIVSVVGENVKNLVVGDHVGVGWIRDSCKECKNCIQGKDNLCVKTHQGIFLGKNAGPYGRQGCEMQGCFSKTMHIDARFAFKLPAGLDLDKAAPLMCAGITVWEPIVDYVTPGSRVGVVSLGGLGHMAVKLARAVGAHVTVLSSSDSKRDRAFALGCHEYVNTSSPEDMKRVQGTFDVIIDTCPVANDLAALMDTLGFGGTYVRVGVPPAESQGFSYGFLPLVFTGKKIAGSVVAGPKNTNVMLTVAADQKIQSDIHIVPFSSVADAMVQVSQGKNKEFRHVLKW